MTYTLGSLFDGSGTCPLAASMCGIEPVWASEIEPFPVAVTSKRFPKVKHLGDITKIDGREIEPVDIITFGSPCQDLSVAGKRAGLVGEKSNLFHEAIRIIREMREETANVYPRFIVWENVPGAFSSNNGHDFRAVLEEITETDVPMPDGGKWAAAGMVELPDRQIAWRILDAQYWGVPQRRRRIFLVADFTGQSAGEILFKPESLSGYTAQGGESRQETAPSSGRGVDKAGGTKYLNGWDYQRYRVVTAGEGGGGNGANILIENHPQDSRVKLNESGVVQTLSRTMGAGGGNVPLVLNERQYALTAGTDLANTLTGTDYKGTQCVFEPKPAQDRDLSYSLDRAGFNQGINAKYNIAIDEELSQTLVSRGPHAVAQSPQYSVRRLTPTECARLQGFPDWWTEGVPGSDSAEYRMWGNGMALPCVLYIMRNIAEVLDE